MPKLRMTDQQKREKALAKATVRAQVDEELPRDQDVAERLGITPGAYAKRKLNPYRAYGFEEAGNMARKLKFTGRELCEICGVPYAPVEEE